MESLTLLVCNASCTCIIWRMVGKKKNENEADREKEEGKGGDREKERGRGKRLINTGK